MSLILVKKIFLIGYNVFIFLVLTIAIQNSTQKEQINFMGKESIPLPLSFIMGTSFFAGTILGTLIPTKTILRK